MKPAPKISEDRHRRMFPPECEHGASFREESREPTLFDSVLLGVRHHRAVVRRGGVRTARVTAGDFFAALGESAEQYTQGWKRTLEQATTALFGALVHQ